jgi:hypothetical protein
MYFCDFYFSEIITVFIALNSVRVSVVDNHRVEDIDTYLVAQTVESTVTRLTSTWRVSSRNFKCAGQAI